MFKLEQVAVDAMSSKEILKLSLNNRNAIDEKRSMVWCLLFSTTGIESPEFDTPIGLTNFTKRELKIFKRGYVWIVYHISMGTHQQYIYCVDTYDTIQFNAMQCNANRFFKFSPSVIVADEELLVLWMGHRHRKHWQHGWVKAYITYTEHKRTLDGKTRGGGHQPSTSQLSIPLSLKYIIVYGSIALILRSYHQSE